MTAMMHPPLILLYRPTGWIGRAITWQTRSPYSHASILIGETIYESREGVGVRFHPPTEEDAAADAFGVRGFDLDDLPILERWLQSHNGKRYDYGSVFRFVSRRQARREADGVWFCSEYAFAAFQHLRYILLARTEPWEVSPGMLSRSPLLYETVNPIRLATVAADWQEALA